MDPFENIDFSLLRENVERRRQAALNKISRIPIAALIWGPAPFNGNLIGECRLKLREELRRRGHLATFSEELYDPNLEYSIQSQQLAHAEAVDIIFSLPDSPGSIAEIHDFYKIPGISSKIVTFLNDDWNANYSNKSLIELESIATPKIQLYKEHQVPNMIIEKSIEQVRKLQEFYFLRGRRF